MKKLFATICVIAGMLLIPASAFAQGGDATGQGRAVITIFAKHSEATPNISLQEVSAKVNGKDAGVTGWTPLRGTNGGLNWWC